MSPKSVADLMSEYSGIATQTSPSVPTDTIIVKLKTRRTAPRLAAATGRGARRSATREPASTLASLVENGYASAIIPIFPGGTAFGAGSSVTRSLAAALAPSPRPLNRASSLVSLKLDAGTNATSLAAHLSSLTDEIEYAYVPPVKYLFPKVSTSRRKRKRRKKLENDPLHSRQWAHAAVRIHEARKRPGFVDSKDVIVAVIDSGIDREHPDLQGSIHSYVNTHSETEDGRDYKGHGTHVAGIIAARINNKIGIAGLCASPIMAIKGLPRRGWNAEKYYQALAHPIDNGAKVVNLSLGGGFDPGEQDIVADLLDAGIVVVAAMGNEYEEGNPVEYPAAYDGVIAVGASDEADRRAKFSCTGRHISLVAPGVHILSTVPTYPSEYAREQDYDSWPGTSMATPHVAAAAALLLAKSPGLTPGQVRDRLMGTADPVGTRSGFTETYGAGRLNIFEALT